MLKYSLEAGDMTLQYQVVIVPTVPAVLVDLMGDDVEALAFA
jgi:hypothetical protein